MRRRRRKAGLVVATLRASNRAKKRRLKLAGGGEGDSSPPSVLSLPSISGTLVEGSTLTANLGGWRGNPTEYQIVWSRL